MPCGVGVVFEERVDMKDPGAGDPTVIEQHNYTGRFKTGSVRYRTQPGGWL